MQRETKNWKRIWTRALALAALAGGAFGQVSIKSGVFSDPTVWDTGEVPGMNAIVEISAGHTVGTAPIGARSATLTVGTLTVFGRLTATYPPGNRGQSVRVRATNLINHGLIEAEDGPGSPGRSGGSVILGAPWGLLPGVPPAFGPLPGTFANHSEIWAGDAGGPRSGGRVRIDWRNGVAENHPFGSIQGGNGARGGSVTFLATHAINRSFLTGGNGSDSFGGTARLSASTFPPGGTSIAENLGFLAEVRGGNGGAGRGGGARVTAFALPPFETSTATNDGDLFGGSACQAGIPVLFGQNAVNRGIMRPGSDLNGTCAPPGRRTYFDPPDGIIEDGADMDGDLIQLVAGSSLTIRNLAPGAITAQENLEITLAPGGVLDLTGLVPGSITATNGTAIRADNILLPAGLGVNDLFGGGPVTVAPGGRHAEPFFEAEARVSSPSGRTIQLDIALANAGNQPEDFEVLIEGHPAIAEFATPMTIHVSLDVGERWSTALDLTLPGFFFPGEEYLIDLTATTTTPGHPAVSAEETSVVAIEDLKCGAEVFGGASPLFLHVEPGVAVTAPLLTITGGQPFAPTLLILSASALPQGLELGVPIPTLYVDPAGASILPLPLDGNGSLQFPVSLSGLLPGLTIAAQTLQLSNFTGSNGLALEFCL